MSSPAVSSSIRHFPRTENTLPHVATFLGVADCVRLLAVEKGFKRELDKTGFRGFSSIDIPARNLPQLAQAIERGRFPKLKALHPTGVDYPELLPQFPSIDELRIEEEEEVQPKDVVKMIKAIPVIHGLRLKLCDVNDEDGMSVYHFAPGEGVGVDEVRRNLEHLRTLDLSGSLGIGWIGIAGLLHCSDELQSVDLTNQWLSDNILRGLARQQNLTELDLSMVTPGGGMVLDLSILTSCRTLVRFKPSRLLKEADLIAMIRANPGMLHLDLSKCGEKDITDELMRSLPATLQSLVLPKESSITDAGCESIIRGCLHLRYLGLGKGKNVTLAGLKRIVELGTDLTGLRLYDRKDLDDAFMQKLGSMVNLVCLALIDCRYYNGEALFELVRLKNLEMLSLNGSKGVSKIFLEKLMDGARKLTALDINTFEERSLDDFEPIKRAIQEKRTALKTLTCYEWGIGNLVPRQLKDWNEENGLGLCLQ